MHPSTPTRSAPDIPLAFLSPPPSSPTMYQPSPLSDNISSTNSSIWQPRPNAIPLRLWELTPEPPSHDQFLHNQQQQQDYKKFDPTKRGRPRADVISNLMVEGTSSPSEIKCKICKRVFPREKSLQAHLRTHTGEKPYVCDYPGCSRAFTQSGQLKTHQRLHAGEKPFVCSAEGCENRYTHANRTCPVHPYNKPQRSTEIILQPSLSQSEDTEEVRQWLMNYKRDRMYKTPSKIDVMPNSSSEENTPKSTHMQQLNTLTPVKQQPKSKRGLVSELEQENVVVQFQNNHLLDHQHLLRTLSPVPLSPLRASSILNRSPPSSSHKRSPSILEQRLASPTVKRRCLGDITSSSTKEDNVLMPKKRWLKEVMESKPNEELGTRPIQWNEEESYLSGRHSPKSWSVARALVELREKVELQNQPLNLSLSNGIKMV